MVMLFQHTWSPKYPIADTVYLMQSMDTLKKNIYIYIYIGRNDLLNETLFHGQMNR